jgi:hypothetical protein
MMKVSVSLRKPGSSLSTHNCLPACFDRQSGIKYLKNETAFTREKHSNLSLGEKNPILIPESHAIAKLLVSYYHELVRQLSF